MSTPDPDEIQEFIEAKFEEMEEDMSGHFKY